MYAIGALSPARKATLQNASVTAGAARETRLSLNGLLTSRYHGTGECRTTISNAISLGKRVINGSNLRDAALSL